MVWKPHAPWRTSTKPGVSAARCASRPAPPMPSWAPTRKCTPLSSPIAPGASCAFRCALWIASSSKTPAGMPPAGPHGQVLWRNRRACATRPIANVFRWIRSWTKERKKKRQERQPRTALHLQPRLSPPLLRGVPKPRVKPSSLQRWSEPDSDDSRDRSSRSGAVKPPAGPAPTG